MQAAVVFWEKRAAASLLASCAVALALVLASCTQDPKELIAPSETPPPDETLDGGDQDGGPGPNAGMSGANGGAGMMSGGRAGSSGEGGQSGASGASGSAGDAPIETCMEPGPDAVQGCEQVCPELCNGEDDDCDGQMDEQLREDACELDHALGACVAGECALVECDAGFRNCDADASTGCEVPETSLEHCGGCNQPCAIPGAVVACIDDECTPVGCDELLGDCNEESLDCETTLTSLEHCGECGEPCGDLANATATCSRGVCMPEACNLGWDDCNTEPEDGCEQGLDDVDHCGGCEQSCDFVGSSGDDCDNLVCRAGACDTGYGDCDGDSLDGCEPLTTIENCGGCGQLCDSDLQNADDASCDDGVCVPECNPEYADCDENPFTGCETFVRTNARCGECDTPCMRDHAVTNCDDGSCSIVRCDDGFGDCNEEESDGCETSLDEDATCGDCDIACAPPNPVCTGRVCTEFECPDEGTADCARDGPPCEIDLRTDAENCGACGFECMALVPNPHVTGYECVNSGCVPLCQPGFANCNGDYRDGCEIPLNTLSNCGGCDQPCSIANATATCATGQCRVVDCAPDWEDCDNDQVSCERLISTVSNCGACDNACNLPNAAASCAGSPGNRSCAIAGCTQFFDDCDDSHATGCEINLQTSVQNCGACDYDCEDEENVSSATCTGGSCNFTCTLPYRDCNNQDSDGCETAINTNMNCGACGVTCSRPNGTTSCSAGTCQLTGCNEFFDNCDMNAANGCESLATLQNCGTCGTQCLPPNASGDCSSRTCAIGTCAAGWADCDGSVSNGCERNTTLLGPCLPETNCTRMTFGGHEYFACPTLRTWSEARARCQLQLYGDLVRIDSAAENTFVQSFASANLWIGATDQNAFSVEGQWRWVNDTALFWTGVAGSGSAEPGMFNAWAVNEPNEYMGNGEDCAEYYDSSATWNDTQCSGTRAFMCEIAGDLCPADDDKTSPGQCGCGVPDTDDDNDRTADCLDECPSDPSKVGEGVCGCGVPDTDSDSDGTADCNDDCPADPSKTDPGQCDCGMPDTDSDDDGTADCNDECPGDEDRTELPCSFPYTPTHFDPTMIDFVSAPSSTLDCATTVTIDTDDPITIEGWCGDEPVPAVRSQGAGNLGLVILPLQGLTIPEGTTLQATGSRPLVLAVAGDASISGTVSARALAQEPGAGGNAACSAAAIGDNGGHDGGDDDGDGGGGGGGFGAAGGDAGWGHFGAVGGLGGSSEGNAQLTPLRGGCQGGNGGRASGGAQGGGGGGAIAIVVSGTLEVSESGVITASGGGGRRGDSSEDGGGGGGSGGAVMLEAGTLSIDEGAWITANGGGGASGNRSDGNDGDHGDNGGIATGGAAQGGNDGRAGGEGGNGGATSSNATAGGSGVCDGFEIFVCFGETGAGGGGGGGGRGRIRLHGVSSCSLGGSTSPSASVACP